MSVAIDVLAQGAVFRGTGDAVRVFVTVTDKEGRLVTTLTQSDFDVRDRYLCIGQQTQRKQPRSHR
jgi:hypothetical protein